MYGRIQRWLSEVRALEDDDVRRTIWASYGPLFKISNLLACLDPGFVPLAILHSIFFYTLVHIYIYLFTVTCYLLKDDFVLVGVQLHYLLLALFGSVFCQHINLHRREICILHKTIALNFYDYGILGLDPKRIAELKKILVRQRIRLIPFVMLIGLIGLFIVVGGPFIDNMIGAAPDVDFINGVYMKTPIPMYFPFAVDSLPAHYAATGFQIIVVSMLALVIIGTVYLNVVSTQNIAHQLRILDCSLKDILTRSKKLYRQTNPTRKLDKNNLMNDKIFQECIKYCIRQNVQHHQSILKYYVQHTNVTSLPIMAAFFMGTLVLALSMVILVEKSERIGLIITNTLAMIGELGNIYIACYFGEEVLTLSGGIRDTIYSVPWYYMDQANKKLIVSFQDCTLHPIEIKGSYIFTCTMNTFSSIVNSAYSYFNMLSVASGSTKEAHKESRN